MLSRRDFAAARDYGERLHARGMRDADDLLLVEADYVLGIAAFWQGEFDTARGHFEGAVERYRAEHRRAHLLRYGLDPKVICLSRLGNTLWFLGRPDAAVRARDAALALADEIGHPFSAVHRARLRRHLAVDMHDARTRARLRGGSLGRRRGQHATDQGLSSKPSRDMSKLSTAELRPGSLASGARSRRRGVPTTHQG